MNLMKRWNKAEPWNPFRELEDMQRQMNTLFGLPTRQRGLGDRDLTVNEWSPLVDIVEDEKQCLIKAALPELKREDIRVSVDNGVLTIRGERKFDHEEKHKKYHRVERACGHFTRSFALPDDSDAARVNAEFKDGGLKVHLPKSPEVKPKSIEVKVG